MRNHNSADEAANTLEDMHGNDRAASGIDAGCVRRVVIPTDWNPFRWADPSLLWRHVSRSTWPQKPLPPPGDNRITWPSGCCEGDLVIVKFRDEAADGNLGEGLLQANNTPTVATWRLECVMLRHLLQHMAYMCPL